MVDRVTILDHGRVLADETPGDLVAWHGADSLEDVYIELVGSGEHARDAEEEDVA